MALLRNTLIVLAMLCVIGVAASAALATVNAQDSNGGVNCVVDENGNGFVEITELFDVIDWYFDRTRCAAPANDPSAWTVSQSDGRNPVYTVLSQEAPGGPFWLTLSCNAQGNRWVFMGATLGIIYSETEDHALWVLAHIDGVLSEQPWYYRAPTDIHSDYMNHGQPADLIEQLLTADEAVFTIPTSGDPYVVSFSVSGLDQHIEEPSELCNSSS